MTTPSSPSLRGGQLPLVVLRRRLRARWWEHIASYHRYVAASSCHWSESIGAYMNLMALGIVGASSGFDSHHDALCYRE